MRYRAIFFHLDYVEKYNGIAAGIVENRQNLTPGMVEKRKNEHETKAAILLRDGIKNGDGARGGYDRSKMDNAGWYEKVTAAKNAKRIAAGLEPYRAVGNAKKPRKR